MNQSTLTSLPPLPYKISDSVMKKALSIKLAMFDVDGVLTDGSLRYSSDGEQIKVFNALDGHGLKMLQQAGIGVGVISARSSQALQTRLSDLGIQHCYLGINNKLAVFEKLIADLKIAPKECAFTGDDVIDLAVMNQCGLKFSVDNGHFIVKNVADWITPMPGGSGAVRAICDVILYSQNCYPLTSSSIQ